MCVCEAINSSSVTSSGSGGFRINSVGTYRRSTVEPIFFVFDCTRWNSANCWAGVRAAPPSLTGRVVAHLAPACSLLGSAPKTLTSFICDFAREGSAVFVEVVVVLSAVVSWRRTVFVTGAKERRPESKLDSHSISLYKGTLTMPRCHISENHGDCRLKLQLRWEHQVETNLQILGHPEL